MHSSRRLSKGPTQGSSCIRMDGLRRARYVLTRSQVEDGTHDTQSFARSAQAEHMVLITDTGAEVLTAL